jgi:NitT/TauT family transport system permease protein
MISVLPKLQDMARSLGDQPGFYAHNLLITIQTALLGFLIGTALALLLGILCVYSKAIRAAVMPVVTALHVTPIIAISPALVVAFGFGEGPHLTISVISAFFPMLINAISGFQAIDAQAAEVFDAMSASKVEAFLRLRLPATLHYLFAGARVGATAAVVGAIVSEFFGSVDGLGAVIINSQANLDLVMMWVAIVLSALLSMVALGLVGLLEKLTIRW